MLTDIKYIGKSGYDRGYAATVCQTHNWRETASYVYELEAMECPICVTLADRERDEREARAEMLARLGHPSICLCHTCAPWEAEYDRLDAEEAARLHLATIDSPNYCTHYQSPWGWCMSDGCRHKACKDERESCPF